MNNRIPIFPAISAFAIILVLTFAIAPRPARAELPPRPTPIEDDPPELASVEPPPGALIRLHGEFPLDWPWVEIHGRSVWTVMQWQDAHSAWHDVDGWQGEFDEVMLESDGTVTGEKTWWLGEANQGTGPFRWLVTLGRDGAPLATSEPFDLPKIDGQLKTITISLASPLTN